jgi:hypothetical protein
MDSGLIGPTWDDVFRIASEELRAQGSFSLSRFRLALHVP